MKNLFYTSPKYLQNLKGINSSASEIDGNILAFERDFIVFEPYNNNNLLNLNTLYAGKRRGQVYKSIKSISLTGFNSSYPHKLRFIWNDAYQPTNHYFRIMISAFDGTSWVDVYDSTNIDMVAAGFVNNGVITFNQTKGAKSISLIIDLSLVPTNSNAIFNSLEPEMVFKKSVFVSADLEAIEDIENSLTLFNSNKKYVTSKRKAMFAFIWDDLQTSDATVFNIFDEYDYKPSFALIPSRMNTANMLDYQNFYLKGCSLLGHGSLAMSTTAATADAVELEMKNAKEVIESYNIKVSGWVTPGSTLHSSFFDLVTKYYGYAFTALNAGVYNNSLNPCKLHRFGLEVALLDTDKNLTSVKARIDTAISNKELLVFYSHALPSTYTNTNGTSRLTETILRQILDYLKEKELNGLCDIRSTDDAIEQYYRADFA